MTEGDYTFGGFRWWRLRHRLRHGHWPPLPINYKTRPGAGTEGPYCSTCGLFLNPGHEH